MHNNSTDSNSIVSISSSCNVSIIIIVVVVLSRGRTGELCAGWILDSGPPPLREISDPVRFPRLTSLPVSLLFVPFLFFSFPRSLFSWYLFFFFLLAPTARCGAVFFPPDDDRASKRAIRAREGPLCSRGRASRFYVEIVYAVPSPRTIRELRLWEHCKAK